MSKIEQLLPTDKAVTIAEAIVALRNLPSHCGVPMKQLLDLLEEMNMQHEQLKQQHQALLRTLQTPPLQIP